jgi:hypothetical protein
MFDNAQSWWAAIDGRRIIFVVKAVGGATTAYMSMYAGLLDPFGTQTENPYPLYLSGSTCSHNRPPDNGGFTVTGITEVFSEVATSPAAFRQQSNGVWQRCINSQNGTAGIATPVYPVGTPRQANSLSTNDDNIVFNGQIGYGTDLNLISMAGGVPAAQVIMPTLTDNNIALVPVIPMGPIPATDNDSETMMRGELAGVYWTPATKSDGSSVASEDTLTIGSDRYIIFQNAHRTERYSFFALKVA